MAIHDPSFKEWLSNFVDSDTNLGDLATDVKKDSTFPDSSDKSTLMEYIESHTPNEVVHRTLSAAIDLYEAASETHDSFSHREPYQK
ncbi:MAG: sterile alpha motif-like domain-containing protein [Lachnospiraceae bacterium]